MAVTILLVEDDANIKKLISASLQDKYDVLTASDGEAGLDVLASEPVDLIITDVMMKKMDGFEFVDALRQSGATLPVLILTAKTTLNDKTIGFTSGADDYLTKPIDYAELRLHVLALLRRAGIQAARKIQVGSITLDEQTYTISTPKTNLELPKKEFELLYKLLSYPGQVFTQEKLLDEIWGPDNFSTEDTIKTHISRIRKATSKIEDFKIETVRGLGYKGVILV